MESGMSRTVGVRTIETKTKKGRQSTEGYKVGVRSATWSRRRQAMKLALERFKITALFLRENNKDAPAVL